MTAISKKAPLTAAKLAQLKRDCATPEAVMATAKRKGMTCDVYDARQEHARATEDFDLACWLAYYADRIYKPEGIADRRACARMLFEADVRNPSYDFFTVFDFGERHYDTLWEMGDGWQVSKDLWSLTHQDIPTAKLIAKNLREAGIEDRAAVAADQLEMLGRSVVVPEGHGYEFDRKHEMKWFAGGPGNSISAFVRPGTALVNDPDQVRIEVRVSLQCPKAHLFVEQGRNVQGETRDLLAGATDATRMPRADSYEDLMATIGRTLSTVPQLGSSAKPAAAAVVLMDALNAFRDEYHKGLEPRGSDTGLYDRYLRIVREALGPLDQERHPMERTVPDAPAAAHRLSALQAGAQELRRDMALWRQGSPDPVVQTRIDGWLEPLVGAIERAEAAIAPVDPDHLPGSPAALAEQAYVDFDFGDGVDVEESGGWEYVEPGTERSRSVYVRTDEGDDIGASHRLNFTVRFGPGGEVDEVFATDRNGLLWGNSPAPEEAEHEGMRP